MSEHEKDGIGMKAVKRTVGFLVVVGLCSLAFIGGMATRTNVSLNVSVSSGAQAAEQEIKLDALANALPMGIAIDAHPRPNHKPRVR